MPRLKTAGAMVRGNWLTAFRWLRRLPPVRSEAFGAAILLAAALAMIAWANVPPSGPAQGDECNENASDSGIIVRSEVIHLWLPESLRELASPQSQVPITTNHNDLRRYLEHQNRQDPRYAVTIRGHQADGDHADVHFIRHPSENPDHFLELLNILADVRGTPGHESATNFPGASTHFISDELLNRGPSEILAEIQRSADLQRPSRTLR
ncbi:hypothetical protein V5E97_30715 [Singulisphaera sp. Ch08]|uniref:Uncharacterized protein n=1 Tax=Singulisphaera sp. Ch08 TaxID=3120278 RepID=A0AAU7CB63_9BACT